MYILHIEHPVANFEGWKRAFDSDPVGRERSGVKRYWISRGVDNPEHVSIDLEFGSQAQAEALLEAMQKVWTRVDGSLITNPQSHIGEVVETRAYGA